MPEPVRIENAGAPRRPAAALYRAVGASAGWLLPKQGTDARGGAAERRREHRINDRLCLDDLDRVQDLRQPLAVATPDCAVPLVHMTGEVEPFVYGHPGELWALVVYRLTARQAQ